MVLSNLINSKRPSTKFYFLKCTKLYLIFLLLTLFGQSDSMPRLPEIVYPILRQKFASTSSSQHPLHSTLSPSLSSSLSIPATSSSTSKTSLALILSEEMTRHRQSHEQAHGAYSQRAIMNGSQETIKVEADALPHASKSKSEIRRSQSSPSVDHNNGAKNSEKTPMLLVTSSAEVGALDNAQVAARIIGAATDGKGIYVSRKYGRVSGERIDGDSDGDTISSKSFSQKQNNIDEVPRLNSGRSIVDELNSEELRRTTMRESKESLSLAPTPLTTPTISLASDNGSKRARAHAVALKTPEFVRPKNMGLEDEPKSLHLVSHDTGRAKGNDNDQKSDTVALHSAKTFTDAVPIERPTSSAQHLRQRQTHAEYQTKSQPSKSSITLTEMENMRKRLLNAANASRRRGSTSHEEAFSEKRKINQIQQHRNELNLPAQPFILPFVPVLGPVIESAAQVNENRKQNNNGVPDHTILPPLLKPPPMFPESSSIRTHGNVSEKSTNNNGIGGLALSRDKTPLKRRRLSSSGEKHTVLPKADESDFDLLMPPKVQIESQTLFYNPQQIINPNQKILAYADDPSLRPQSPNSVLASNLQPPGREPVANFAPSLTAFIPANVLNPNAKLDLCCKKQGVSHSCQSLCNFDTFTDKSLVNAVLHGQCPGPELGRAFDCATSKVDHSACCRRAGIDTYGNGQCMPFCHTHLPTPPNIFNYVACLQVFETIKNCYRDYQQTSPNIYGD